MSIVFIFKDNALIIEVYKNYRRDVSYKLILYLNDWVQIRITRQATVWCYNSDCTNIFFLLTL